MLIQRHGLFLTVPEYVLMWSVLFQGNGNPCQKAGGCFPWKHAPLSSVNHLRNTSSNMSLSFSLSSALISRYLSISSKNVFSLSFLSASSCILWRRGECLQWCALSCAHQRNNFILREVWVINWTKLFYTWDCFPRALHASTLLWVYAAGHRSFD